MIDYFPGQVLLDVGGVAYEIEVSQITIDRLPPRNSSFSLHTHLVVREDAQILFGFPVQEERDLFRVLIRVNGVGPRLGLALLSGMDAAAFVQCVKDNDVRQLIAIPGIGKKTAERLMIEVSDRLEEWDHLTVDAPGKAPCQEDAETALINLGYKPQEAALALASIDWTVDQMQDASVEEILKKALKVLSG